LLRQRQAITKAGFAEAWLAGAEVTRSRQMTA